MADRFYLSNDAVGYTTDDADHTIYANPLVNDTSAHGNSAGNVAFVGPMPGAGKVTDFQIAVFRPAISASGFVSGTVDADLRLNSASILSTKPAIAMLAASAAIGAPYWTGGSYSAGQVTKGVVNGASASFASGDFISYDYNARSVGSAAAGAAGIGCRAYATVRFSAV